MLALVSIGLVAGVLLATRRYGTRMVLTPAGLLCMAGVLAAGPSVGVAPLMGLIAGFQVERRQSYGQVVAATAAPGAGLGVWLLFGQEEAERHELAARLSAQLEAMGMEPPQAGYSLQEMVSVVLRVQPAVGFLELLLIVVVAYRLSLWAGPRLQLALPPALPFAQWRPWEEIIWVLIAGLALGLVGSGLAVDAGANLAVVAAGLYVVQGLALLQHLLRRGRVPRLLEVLIYVVLLLTSGLALIVLAAMGLLDTWFDWRGLRAADTERG
ncbi:MAG: DUF2232 domain-containing protein [Candidatus Latescibacterota bacterium]